MADLTIDGSSDYPTSTDTYTTVVAGVTQRRSRQINGPSAGIVNVQNELGTNPSGTAATVAARLSAALNADGSLQSGLLAAGTDISISYSGGVFTINASGGNQALAINNLGFQTSVFNGNLRVEARTISGGVPSSTNQVAIRYRSPGLPTGSQVLSTISSTVASITLASGAALGFRHNEYGRLYVWGVLATSEVTWLGISRDARHSEATVSNTTAMAAGVDDLGVIYTEAAHFARPVRCLGYIEAQTSAVRGVWQATPSLVQPMGPGVKRTGDIVQRVVATTSALSSGAVAMPIDDTPPLLAEGYATQFATITPTSAVNPLYIDVNHLIGANADVEVGYSLIRNTEASAIGGGITDVDTNTAHNVQWSVPLATPGVSGTIGFMTRYGTNAGDTVTFGGRSAGRLFGGIAVSRITITEEMA